MSADRLLQTALKSTLEFVKKAIQEELEAQGHRASGKLIDTIEIKVEPFQGGWKGGIYMQDYAFILDKGVSPQRVPYSPGSGAGSSKYIEALMNWIAVIKPGMSARERKSFAFAIAQKAKNEGHPTRGSYAFSRNGRRKEWAKYAIDQNEKQIEQLLNLGSYVAALVDNFVTEYQKLIVG